MSHSNSLSNTFIRLYQLHHSAKQPVKQTSNAFFEKEKVFLSLFGLGLFETYDFLYQKCQDADDFKNWIKALKGEDFFLNAEKQFNLLDNNRDPEPYRPGILSDEQQLIWKKQGYLQIENLIDAADCDAVVDLICDTLAINLENEETWYHQHEKLQGLMLQLYQDETIARIRNNSLVKDVFMDLYRNKQILPNCEKVSYNPPINAHFSFKGSPLHWDFDVAKGPQYYIQGLVYLNDVPSDRGAFTVIPAFHHQIEEFRSAFETTEAALQALRGKGLEKPVPGKKGDLIVWLEALPHAASPNHSCLPRFVQYINFSPVFRMTEQW